MLVSSSMAMILGMSSLRYHVADSKIKSSSMHALCRPLEGENKNRILHKAPLQSYRANSITPVAVCDNHFLSQIGQAVILGLHDLVQPSEPQNLRPRNIDACPDAETQISRQT